MPDVIPLLSNQPMPEQEFDQARQGLTTVRTLLSPYLLRLEEDDVKTIYKASDADINFYRENLPEITNAAEFLPKHIVRKEVADLLLSGDQLLELENLAKDIYFQLLRNRLLRYGNTNSRIKAFTESIQSAVTSKIPAAIPIHGRIKEYYKKRNEAKKAEASAKTVPATNGEG